MDSPIKLEDVQVLVNGTPVEVTPRLMGYLSSLVLEAARAKEKP